MRDSPKDWALAAAALAALVLLQDAALAQAARHPFAVGPSEGPVGATDGVAGLLLAWQSKFHMELKSAAKALKTDPFAFASLAAASFAYGVFHAAGPGHGKAVLASYMIANETALRRGLLLAGLAALLQGAVAITLVGVAAVLLGATAQSMTDAATWIETASYAAIAALGARLAYVKGGALLAACREPAFAPALAVPQRGAFACEALDDPPSAASVHLHGPDCGHMHAIDAARLGVGFRWGDALATVVAAGLRPCSGAILALVFTLSQGAFMAGVGATLLMSAGTAITTGALAATAVFAKDLAARLAARKARRADILLRSAEFLAALLVLAFGAALLLGARIGPPTS